MRGLSTVLGGGGGIARLSSVLPSFAAIGGALSVVIKGSGFTGATAVQFGGTNATSFTVNSDTQITATCPAHAQGDVAVSVTVPSGSTSGLTFSYLAGLVEWWCADDAPVVSGNWSGNWVGRIAGKIMQPHSPSGAPQVLAGGTPGHAAIKFTGQYGQNADLVVAQPLTIWAWMREDIWGNASNILFDTAGAACGISMYAGGATTPPSLEIYGGTGYGSPAEIRLVISQLNVGEFGLLQCHYDAANSYISVGRGAHTNVSATIGTGGISAGFFLASWSGGSLANITISDLLFANTAASGYSEAQWQAAIARDRQKPYLSVIPDGDSITVGISATSGWPYYAWQNLTTANWFNPSSMNMGQSGGGVGYSPGHPTNIASAPTTTDYAIIVNADCKRTLDGMNGGSNDLAYGRTAAQIKTDIATYTSARRTAATAAGVNNFFIVGSTILPRGFATDGFGTFAAKEAQRVALNADMLANPSQYGYDLVVDFASLPHAADFNNATYYSDTVHPTDALYQDMGAAWATAVIGAGYNS